MAKKFPFVLIAIFFVVSDIVAYPETQREWLLKFAQEQKEKYQKGRSIAESIAIRLGLPIIDIDALGRTIELQRFENGQPVYYITENLNAARTISTDKVWPGGSGGFSLTGYSETLGIWDNGKVRNTHQELHSRVIFGDDASVIRDHATHVAGTMIASGVSIGAKGMSYQGMIQAYDWNNDQSEMVSAAANGLKVSNHSYGIITGWHKSASSWHWYGDSLVYPTEDYLFGFYSAEARNWDNIARKAPYYLIVKSAGNDRLEGPTSQPITHTHSGSGSYICIHNLDGAPNGYDCISHAGVAKNILTVGAVDDIPNGYTNPNDVIMSSFSCWGPTDDGRIKPDIVANGIGLLSCIATSDNSYASYSGTSMSAPNASGSIGLLLQARRNFWGNNPLRSSTIKGLIIHTADEAGPHPGPDYMFGWGLMNTLKAVQVMKADSSAGGNFMIREYTLNNGGQIEFQVVSDGTQPLRVTICWTDTAGTPPLPSLDPPDIMLVNDLDLRVISPTNTTYYPWVLDPSDPSAPATTRDNIYDNVEQVHIASPNAGIYTIRINHKGTLVAAPQPVSVIVTGIVKIKDIQVIAIDYPVGIIESTATVITPRVRVKNNGNNPEIFDVCLNIGNFYFNVRTKFLEPGNEDTVNFSAWIPIRGTFSVRCSVYLENDTERSNDTLQVECTVNVRDFAATRITTPLSPVQYGDTVIPKVWIHNYGTVYELAIPVTFYISGAVYHSTQYIDLAPNDSVEISFDTLFVEFEQGTYLMRCTTKLNNDAVPSNNLITQVLTTLVPGWTELCTIPTIPAGKGIKDGGALTVVHDKIYALQGGNTPHLYQYDIGSNTWSRKRPIPYIVEQGRIYQRNVKAGGSLVALGCTLYAFKGGITSEFWAYLTESDSWIRKASIPERESLSLKLTKVKAGGALVAHGDYIYAFKGGNTNEFWLYNPVTDSWYPRKPLITSDGKKIKAGASLVSVDDTIYAFVGGNTYHFYAYTPDTWIKKGNAIFGNTTVSAKKKIKDGAALTATVDGKIFAFKGGNTKDLGFYDIALDTWFYIDTIPGIRKIKYGASIVYHNYSLYAVKGGNNSEFWRYTPPIAKSNLRNLMPTVLTENRQLKTQSPKVLVNITPNPFSKYTTIKYNVAVAGKVTIKLYNVSGQLIETLINQYHTPGSYTIRLNAEHFKKGLYFLRFFDIINSMTLKLTLP